MRTFPASLVRLFCALALALLAQTLPAAAQQYAVIDLGTLGGASSEASAINSHGDVVGWSATAAGPVHGFIVRAGVMGDLGTMQGGTTSFATGINDLGQVTGYGGLNAFGPQFREIMNSFLWENGSMVPLGGFPFSPTFNTRHPTTAAFGINGLTQIVGTWRTPHAGLFHGYRWQNGVVTDVSGGIDVPLNGAARAINEAGRIVGELGERASLWQDGEIKDLGTLPGHLGSRALGINASAQIVGESLATDGTSRAVLWQTGEITDLGTLPNDVSSRAIGINGPAHVVGASAAADGTSRAFIWRHGNMRDLNTLIPADSGWALTSAAAINDAGEIVGTGILDGQTRAFLLTRCARGHDEPKNHDEPKKEQKEKKNKFCRQ